MGKKAFTLVEVLFASGILSMVITIGISVLFLMNSTLYDGQIESTNRSNLNDMIYYMTREIQSAEGIKISGDGKTLKIKQRGGDDYSLIYKITDNYPVDYLSFKDKRLIDLDYAASGFAYEGGRVKVTLAIYKNNVKASRISQEFGFEVYPRSALVLLEVSDT